VRLKESPKEKPADIRLNDDNSYTIKHFWAFPVIDRNDLGGVIKIFELTQTGIMGDIEALVNSEDWNNPKEYDLSITGEGKGLERRYNVVPSPHKPLTEEEKKLVSSRKVNLEALFYSADPFDDKWVAPAKIEEDIDVAF
jgi:hypothetical protein